MSSALYTNVGVAGGGGVGKTALILQLLTGQFVEDYDPTIKEQFRKQVRVDDENCLLMMHDLPEYEHGYVGGQVRGCHGFLFVNSVTSRVSFALDVARFRECILRTLDVDDVPMVLVGNKCDDEFNRRVSTAEGAQMAESLGRCPFLETSAKRRINVEESFDALVRAIRRHRGATGQDGGGQNRSPTRRCVLY